MNLNINRIKNRRKSVIYSWIASYISIILIMAVSMGAIYYVGNDTIESEIKSSNGLLIEKLKDNMDNALNDIERFSVEVAMNESVQEVLSIDDINEIPSYYVLYKVSDELKKYKIFNSALKQFYIYFNNLQTVATPGFIYSQTQYYDWHLKTKDNQFDNWLETMNKDFRGDYMVMSYHDDILGDQKTIGFIRTLPFPVMHGKTSANLVILLDPHALLASGAEQTGGRSLYIMDKNSNIIAGDNNDDNLAGLDYASMNNEYGSINKTLGDKKVVISYTTSKINGWKYIVITPEGVFWKKAMFIRNIMLGGLLISILLGGIISSLYLKKNYNPLKEIVTYFKEHLHSNQGEDNNEFGYIWQTLNETLEQKKTIQLKLEQQSRAMKTRFIEDILKGKNKHIPIHELMTNYNISFNYDSYTVMAVYIENVDDDFYNKEYKDVDSYELIKFIIINVVEELINRKYCGYMTEVDDMMVCLVNLNSISNSYKAELLSIAAEAKKFFEQYYKIEVSFAIGALHESIEGVPEAYSEAINAMEYSKVMGISKVTFYDEIINETGICYYYPIEKEHQIINCIKSGDFTAAESIANDIFKKNFVNNTPSLGTTQCMMFDMISTVLKTVNELEDEEDRSYFDKTNPAGELIKCKTFVEMKDKMLQILKDACSFFGKCNKQTNYRIRDEVIDIIEKSYKDSNLCIASIADQLDKHPYYISRVFKEQTGEGILEYINRVRVNMAKELLKENAWNQEEIAEKVGYSNVRTFQRAFKKQEGTSPGKLKI